MKHYKNINSLIKRHLSVRGCFGSFGFVSVPFGLVWVVFWLC
jgi:hypothetical protein